jgi:predicted glycosyltransferase
MRIWVDITDSSHVLFFAPIVRRLESAGHTVTVTARRFAQTELLLKRYDLRAIVSGQHRGTGLAARAVGLAGRTAHLIASAREGEFDVAVGHDASDLALAAWTLGIPQLAVLDDERSGQSRHLNLRLVDAVAAPEAIPLARLYRLGVGPERVLRFAGFKEEYYLYDFEPDTQILAQVGVTGRRIVGVVRPANAALPNYSARARTVDHLLSELAGKRNLTLVVIARSDEQRQHFLDLALKNVVVPEEAIDGLSLIAAADFMIGSGGVMMREAAAIGTPAYTLSTERPGAVDDRLIAAGRLRPAASATDIATVKKNTRTAPDAPRDPQLFVDQILALARRRPAGSRLGRLL